MKYNYRFWKDMEFLIRNNSITIDRPKDSAHPRYPQMIYPLDYGYLENTTAGDGAGIDVWLGSTNTKILTGILCTFDKLKRDAEVKILLGCTSNDMDKILRFYNNEMSAIYVPNPTGD